MSDINKKIDKALDSLLEKPGLSHDLGVMNMRVKELESKLKEIEFPHKQGIQVLIDAGVSKTDPRTRYFLGYHFVKRRIVCEIRGVDGTLLIPSKPLAEHGWTARQHVFFHLPELLKTLEAIK